MQYEETLIALEHLNDSYLALDKAKAVHRVLIGELEADSTEPSEDFGVRVRIDHAHIASLLNIMTDYLFDAAENLQKEIDRMESMEVKP